MVMEIQILAWDWQKTKFDLAIVSEIAKVYNVDY